jgi:hypothetical protein
MALLEFSTSLIDSAIRLDTSDIRMFISTAWDGYHQARHTEATSKEHG